MSAAHSRPELAHATRDTIRVIVQFGVGLEGNDVLGGRSGKPFQIHFLTAGNGFQNGANELGVFGGQIAQCGDSGLDLFQQRAFGGQALVADEIAEIQRLGDSTEDPLAQGVERLESLRHRDNFSIRDGVGGASEQISQADLRAHGRGQHAQRQVKRARILKEQSFESGMQWPEKESPQKGHRIFGEFRAASNYPHGL
jgi:hypothetical protein